MKIGVAEGTGTVGRHITDRIRQHGHEPVVLSWSTGVDLLTGDGLAAALDGVDGVIDVVNTAALSARASKRFFGTNTATLLTAEAAAGVRHHVALSIVNAARVAAGYYAGKALQEDRVERGPVPWTILRSTQFHEFAAQTLGRQSRGKLAPDRGGGGRGPARRAGSRRTARRRARPGRPRRGTPRRHGARLRPGHALPHPGHPDPAARRDGIGDARRRPVAVSGHRTRRRVLPAVARPRGPRPKSPVTFGTRSGNVDKSALDTACFIVCADGFVSQDGPVSQ
ncbi:MAG: 3-beta hydroxysteroid dehydrogenase [Cryobacterium sp.]|nr:3-beta hydroxysteroid dehydrogenase [Cryobacterium sp.]